MAFVDIYVDEPLALVVPDPAQFDVYNDETAAASLGALLPPGRAYDSLSVPGSVLSDTIRRVARTPARLAARLRAFVRQRFPDTADEGLPDWEETLGLDSTGLTVEERRAAVAGRLVARGGLSAAYFLGIARSLGYADATVTPLTGDYFRVNEHRLPYTNAREVSRVNDRLWSQASMFTFVLEATSLGVESDKNLATIIGADVGETSRRVVFIFN